MRETHKIVELEGRTFQINQFTAQVGSWIVFKLGSKLLPIIGALMAKKITTEEAALHLFATDLNSLTKSEFFDIQNEALSVVCEMEQVGAHIVPEPIKMADGRWKKSEIENNIILVMSLTLHALLFNLSPLFNAENWKGVQASLPDLQSFGA